MQFCIIPPILKKAVDLRIFDRFKQFFKSLWLMVYNSISLRDIFVFGGLALLGYGLYQFIPWVSLSVCGLLLMLLGLGWLDRGHE